MRLTLRTLLAYLDDVLEPSQTKLIGQKIQESPRAELLISKIREVMRRRRLLAPDVSGARVGIDPNIVAQYLDNTLPAEQVAEVEGILLESDELLAEVAACHQVLTLVLGEPFEVSQSSRERLYALGPVAPSDQLRVEGTAPTAASPAATSDRATESSAPTMAARVDVPAELVEYLRPQRGSQRLVLIAGFVLLMLVCGVLLNLDSSFQTGVREAKRELGKPSRESNPARELAAAPNPALEPGTVPPVAEMDSQPVAANPNATPNGRLAPAPLPDESVSVVVTPQSGRPPAKSTVPTPPGPGSSVPADSKPVAAVPAVVVQYLANEGVVLALDETDGHWYVVPRQSTVQIGQSLACLEPYEAQMSFAQGALRATLLGDSMWQIIGATDMAPTGLELRRGRVIFQGSRREAQSPVALAVVVGQDIWKLELLSPETVCAIEISPREPSQFETLHDANWYVGVLYVLAGSVKWTSIAGTSQVIADRTGVPIVPERGAATVRSAPISFPTPPEWTDIQKRKLAPLRRYAGIFEKKFGIDDRADQTLQALITDDNANISGLAVRGLTLTNSHAAVVQALSLCKNEEGRFAARDGLYLWLPVAAEHGPQLKRELETQFPPAEAEAVYRMLWGFTREDGRNKVTSLQLAGWLRSQNLTVRELAYHWVAELTKPRKWDYRAIESIPGRREPAVRRIEAHIEREGALVKSE